MTEYRAFRPSDAEQCRNLVLSHVGDATALDPERSGKLRKWIEASPRCDDFARMFCIVAVRKGKVIGMGGLDGSNVKRMYVLREYRGCGVGRTVHEWLEREARRRGLTRLNLMSYINAVEFYEVLGYTKIGEKNWYLDGVEVQQIVMTKDLT
jgi:GNAT superfamily N-acetyltransferase